MKASRFAFRHIVSAACLLVFGTMTASSQISLQAGGGVGFVVASGDLSGTTVDFYNGSKYGFSNGYTIFGKARTGVSGITFSLEADYIAFSASGDTEPGQGSVNTSQKIMSFKVGPEYQLVSMRTAPIKPYIGANIALNSFRGEATFNGVSRVPTGTFSIPSTSRVGLGFTIGTLVTIGMAGTLDFNISYNFMNAFGKEWTTIDQAQARRSDSYSALNDDADPVFRPGDTVHIVESSRSIHTLMFTVSYLFSI